MKINKGLLKQMIAEEMAKFNTMSEQEEEVGQDEAGEAPPAAGGIDANKALDMKLPQFVQALQTNQEDVIKSVLNGLGDKNANDDKVKIVPTTVPIKALKPTQSEVVFSKSIPFALENPEIFMKYLSGDGPFKVGPPGNDAIITLNGKFILDGHHRWSSLYSINPDASMHTFDIQVPGLQPLDALKLMQASIKKHSGAVPSNKGGGVNLFQIDTGNLTKGVQKSATPENLQKLIDLGFLKGAQAVDEQEGNQLQLALRKLLKLYGTNIARMRANNAPVSGASSREPMPQTDKPSDSKVTAGGSTPAALEPLEKGAIDFKQPFAEIYNPDGMGDEEKAARAMGDANCEDVKAKYSELRDLKLKYDLEYESQGYMEYMSMAQDAARAANSLKKQHAQCFAEDDAQSEKDHRRRVASAGNFHKNYKLESKKDLLKRIVAEEVAKMEIDAVQKEGIFDFFRKKKKEEPAPEPEPEAPSEKELEAQAIEKIKDMFYLGSDDEKHMGYFRDSRTYSLRNGFTGRAMETGHFGAEDVADQFDEYPLKHNAENMHLKDSIAQAIYNQIGKVPSKSYVEGVVDTLTRAAKDRYEYMTRDVGGGSSSSSRKSGFDKWQSGEGDNYNYMTRMENLSKKQLAKIVKEELAQLKK
jgi:hypothetical protein